jgi:hypothetical protein
VGSKGNLGHNPTLPHDLDALLLSQFNQFALADLVFDRLQPTRSVLVPFPGVSARSRK